MPASTRSPLDRGRAGLAAVGERVRSRWLATLVVAASLVQASGLLRVLPGDQPPPMRDSIVFEAYGWHLLRGHRLYVDLWEVKPPLNYQTTAVLALLSGGDPYVYHYLAVLATAGAAVGCAALVGLLVVELTADRRAALVGGLAVLVHPVVFMRPAYGFKSKFFVALAGLLAVYLLLRDRPVAGGAAAAAAAGYWQLGIVFPLVALGVAARRGGREAVGRVVAGGLAMTALTVGPVVLRGGLVAMVAEVVLVPLLVTSGGSAVVRAYWVAVMLGPLVALVALGGVGVATAAVPGSGGRPGTGSHRVSGTGPSAAAPPSTDDEASGPFAGGRHWWPLVLWGWFVGHLVLLNVDYYPDLVPLLVLSGLGVGLVVARWPGDPARAVAAAVVLVAVISTATAGGVLTRRPYEPPAQAMPVASPDETQPPYIGGERLALLYEDVEPTVCHVFVSKRQRAWMRLTGSDNEDTVCGALPPGYRWLRSVVPRPLRGPTPGAVV